MNVHDYETADELLKSNTRFKRWKVENNTWIQQSDLYDDVIYLILHDTPILTYYKNGDIGFNVGRWPSKTTRGRMNSFQKRIHIYSYKKKWHFNDLLLKYSRPFKSGMVIHPDGQIVESVLEDQVESENFGHLMGHY